MKRTRYREEQIIGILTEHEAGAKCADLCRKHGMSEGIFYAWKGSVDGMDESSVAGQVIFYLMVVPQLAVSALRTRSFVSRV